MPFAKTKSIEKRSPGAFETYRAVGAGISKGDIVRVTGISVGGAYWLVQKALGDGNQPGKLMIATVDSDPVTNHLLVTERDILTLDTSSAALGDPVYLSDSTAGAPTLTATATLIGHVDIVGASGLVSVDPAGMAEEVWPGQPAAAGVIVAAQPAEGETYTLQVGATSVVYTFTSTPVAATDVERDGAVGAIQSALEAAIIANQGDDVSAIDYGAPSPLYLFARQAKDIVQTDGTGGDLTIYKPDDGTASVIGQPVQAPGVTQSFHIRYEISAINVTEGIVPLVLPQGWSFVEYTALVFGAKDGVAPLACTATLSLPGETSLGSNHYYIELTNGGGTPFTANDTVVFWGIMKRS